MVHTRTVSAPVDHVYRLIADVTLWPVIFEPTVYVTHSDRTEYSERFRLWAQVAGEVRTWVSKRELDPSGYCISFRQEQSSPPVTSMAGTWSLHPVSDDRTKVVLHHQFSVTEPNALEMMKSAVDQNSIKELAALARVAELGHPVDEVVSTFSDTIIVDGRLSDVYDFVYRSDLWAARLPHVARVELTEDEQGTQYLEMDTVTAEGSAHTTRSVRVCSTNSLIAYKQILPPAMLLGHSGLWTFTQLDHGVKVIVKHVVLIDPSAARAVLGPDSTLTQARTYIREALGGNGRATLACIGQYVGKGAA